MPRFLAAIIPALWFSAAAFGAGDSPLGRLAAGIHAYERQDYRGAAAALARLGRSIPKLADYAAYYEAAASVELKDFTGVPANLNAAHRTDVPSPLSGRAWILEARARAAAGAPLDAVRLLRDHYTELPQPDGDLALAAAYETAADLTHAADFYQRVYYEYPSGEAAMRAAAALLTLKNALGPGYPAPLPRQMLQRGDRLLATGDYAHARNEFQGLAAALTGAEREAAGVRAGAADFLAGNTRTACAYLRTLEAPESEAGAERLYYIAECARRADDDDAMLAAVKDLGRRYPRSPWRLKALVSAGNRFLVANRPDRYVPLYREAYECFPAEPLAALSHWKVAFHQYFQRDRDAAALLREHLRDYANHTSAAAALYFLGRLHEERSDPGAARACYDKLRALYPNYYYGVLAGGRLAESGIGAAAASGPETQFLAGVTFPAPPRPALDTTPVTALRVERAALLRSARLDELAQAELRFGALHDGRPQLLGMEMARAAGAPFEALRVMKRYAGDALAMPLEAAPAGFWKLLFPMPWRPQIMAVTRAHGIDSYLLAALIRQESEFNPGAVSGAGAYGLTQVRPGTARMFAGRVGVRRVSTRILKQPDANLKFGAAILSSMLAANGGKLEQTLASYNAGPRRVAEWMSRNSYREPAEFVESIPFTETREYVQSVLRNVELYRRIYSGTPDNTAAPAAPRTRKPAPRRSFGAGKRRS